MQIRTLKESINSFDNITYIIEAHSGISAKIVEHCGGEAIWASGLALSTAHGVRDANELSYTNVLTSLEEMKFCTSLPILVDGDTGYGNFNNARYFVKKLCALGIDGVVFEDKVFPKLNSFSDAKHELASLTEFCGKIKACKDSQTSANFCVIARTEAFIAQHGIDEALNRADSYITAGADAIVVHSKKETPEEILAFCNTWNKRAPVIIIPTTYEIKSKESLTENGISSVIFANQLLRASVKSMIVATNKLLSSHSATDIDMVSVNEIFDMVNMQELKSAEQKYL